MTIPTLPSLPGLVWPVDRASGWNNTRHEALAGQRTVNPLFFIPIYQWAIGYSILRVRPAYLEWQQFLDFFNSLGADASVFYYDDPDDDIAVDQVFGSGDGVTTLFQLNRRLYAGGFSEAIQSPIGSITVKVNGIATAAFTLGNAGIVTMSGPPALGTVLTWSGSFKWLCRFDKSSSNFSKFDAERYELKKITFSREKL